MAIKKTNTKVVSNKGNNANTIRKSLASALNANGAVGLGLGTNSSGLYSNPKNPTLNPNGAVGLGLGTNSIGGYSNPNTIASTLSKLAAPKPYAGGSLGQRATGPQIMTSYDETGKQIPNQNPVTPIDTTNYTNPYINSTYNPGQLSDWINKGGGASPNNVLPPITNITPTVNPTVKKTVTPEDINKYIAMAKLIYDPIYKQNLLDYTNQQNSLNTQSKNNINNESLARGTARSSISQDGLVESDKITQKAIGDYTTSQQAKESSDVMDRATAMKSAQDALNAKLAEDAYAQDPNNIENLYKAALIKQANATTATIGPESAEKINASKADTENATAVLKQKTVVDQAAIEAKIASIKIAADNAYTNWMKANKPTAQELTESKNVTYKKNNDNLKHEILSMITDGSITWEKVRDTILNSTNFNIADFGTTGQKTILDWINANINANKSSNTKTLDDFLIKKAAK